MIFSKQNYLLMGHYKIDPSIKVVRGQGSHKLSSKNFKKVQIKKQMIFRLHYLLFCVFQNKTIYSDKIFFVVKFQNLDMIV